MRNILARLDPEAQQKEEAKRKASAANRKLGAILSNKAREGYESDSEEEYERRRRGDRPRIEDLNLSAYEQTIAMEVVAPEEIPVSFEGKKPLCYFFLDDTNAPQTSAASTR